MVDDAPISGQAEFAHGAYGLQITGIPDNMPGLVQVPDGWPQLRIQREQKVLPDPQAPGSVGISDREGEVWLPDGGLIALCRRPLTARFTTRTPVLDDALLHPLLGLPAAIAGHWLGRHALHGGAFLHRGRAWGLLGIQRAGKSATLGGLLRRGHQIVSDDVLIIDGTSVFAGPRSVDLRADAAELIGGEALGILGARHRWRLRPESTASSVQLGGFVVLEWGDATVLEPLDPGSRLGVLVANSVFRPERRSARALLELAALPAWRFTRKSALASLDSCIDQLLEVVAPSA